MIQFAAVAGMITLHCKVRGQQHRTGTDMLQEITHA
jgi:hypothetical protein